MRVCQVAMKTPPSPLYPGESRRTIAKIETATVKVEEIIYARGLCVARHFHDTANLLYIVAGVHWSGHSRGGDTCVPHTVRFLPAGEPHENYFPVESRCLNVELRQAILDLAAEHGKTIFSPGQVTGVSSATLGARLHQELSKKDDDSPLDIEGLVLRLLLRDEGEATGRREGIPHWLLRVREMLREEPNNRRTLTDLSRCVGRHPVQVSRQFHQHFGCTIGEYLRLVRIARAQSLLSCPEIEVSRIALDCGFCDQSHFTSAFRRLTGMPPYRYRLYISNGRRVPTRQFRKIDSPSVCG
jgi:AraC family transcriptional regulator